MVTTLSGYTKYTQSIAYPDSQTLDISMPFIGIAEGLCGHLT